MSVEVIEQDHYRDEEYEYKRLAVAVPPGHVFTSEDAKQVGEEIAVYICQGWSKYVEDSLFRRKLEC